MPDRLQTANTFAEPATHSPLEFSANAPTNPCHQADWLGKQRETFLLGPVYPVFVGSRPVSHGSQPRTIRYAVGLTSP